MAVNLINTLRSELTDDAVGRIASFLGETPANTQSAIGYAVPATVGALAQKAQTAQGAADLFGILQRGGFDGTSDITSALVRTGTPASDHLNTGATLVSSLFGQRQSALADLMAAQTGIRSQSARSLLALVMPFVLNRVGREATAAGGLNASSIARLLGDQMGFLRNSMPAGLASVLGFSGVEEPVRAVTQPVFTRPRPSDRGTGLGWLGWALPLVVLGLLLWGFTSFRYHALNRRMAAATGPAPIGTSGTATLVKERLSCGQELDVAPDGVERKLVAFIDDPNRSPDRETWFTFDRLAFQSGSATLTPGSEAQVRNIAAILTCYPNVNLKFGGYTDNTGDPATNQRLSQARADSARQAVVGNGVDPSRIEAEGYGQDHPVASNDSDEGRQRNRRIDIRVTKK